MKLSVLLLCIFTSFGFQSYSQDRKIELLSVLYEQSNHRIIARKTKRLIDKKGYDDNELAHLFRAASLAKLSQNKNYVRFHPNALQKSIQSFENYYELDKNKKFSQKESVMLQDLREIYDKVKSVSIQSEAYSYLMKKSKPLNVKQKPIVVKKEKVVQIKHPEIDKHPEVDTVADSLLSEADKLIAYAKKFIGVPYKYGGVGDDGFDCSGYTQYVYSKCGHKLPRSARTQKDKLESISIANARKGDLVFFSRNKRKNNITHVGIVISKKGEQLTMIHASSSQGIMITNVATNTYWKPKLVAAGRIIGE